MNSRAIALMGLLSFLFGCEPRQAYHKKGGRWYFEDRPLGDVVGTLVPLNDKFAKAGSLAFFRDARIPDADGTSFEALSEHYAKDFRRVYYCDTRRDSRDYFSTQRIRIRQVSGADPASFRYVGQDYARDTSSVFYEGTRLAVQDAATFQPLEYGFARDRLTGYYMQSQIPGSDGATFAVVDAHYAKDRVAVYYSVLEPGTDGSPPVSRSEALPDSHPASFRALDSGYAVDSAQVYYRANILPEAPGTFQVLTLGYAKSDRRVYYLGAPIDGADPASFTVLEAPSDTANARDTRATYLQGKRTPLSR